MIVGFRDFTHSVQTGRPRRCFQAWFGFHLGSKRISVRVYLGNVRESNKNSFGGTGEENLAPPVGFLYGDTVLPIFMDSISPPRHWQRYLALFRGIFCMRAQSANPRRAERKSANSKNIRRIPICHHELACAFSPKYQALSFRGFFPRRNRAAFRTSPARATPHAVRTSEEQPQGVLAIDSGRAHRASHASVSEEGRVRGLPSSQIVCARRRGNDRGRA